MNNSRRDFLKKSFGVMGVAATTVALSKIGFSEAQALEIGQTNKITQNPMDVSGQCGFGMGCSGGGGQCGFGMGCGGGGSSGGGDSKCGFGMGCGGS